MTHQENNHPQQMTIAEAAKALNVSEQTVRRRIKSGKLNAELVDGQYIVEIDNDYQGDYPGDYRADQSELVKVLRSQNADLKTQIARLESQIDHLNAELSESRHRSDTIIMQLSKAVEKQQTQIQDQTLTIEDLRQPKSFWQKLLRRQPQNVQDAPT